MLVCPLRQLSTEPHRHSLPASLNHVKSFVLQSNKSQLSVVCNLFFRSPAPWRVWQTLSFAPQGVSRGNTLIFLRVSKLHREDDIVSGISVPALAPAAWRANKSSGSSKQPREQKDAGSRRPLGTEAGLRTAVYRCPHPTPGIFF